MSYIQEQQKKLMLDRLKKKAELSTKNINDIVYALQIATGNATGVGQIKGILLHLQQSPVHIIIPSGNIKINDKFELAKLIKSIDKYIDITSDRDFKDYF